LLRVPGRAAALILISMNVFDTGSFTNAYGLAALALGAVLLWVWMYRVYANMRRERQARAAAEGAASHAQRSAQLTAALGRARSPAAAIEAAVQEPLHALRADGVMLLLIAEDGATARVARAVGYEPPPLLSAPVSLRDAGPIRDVAHRGAFVVLESREARAANYDGAPEDPLAPAYAALAAVPVIVGGRTSAVVRLDFREPRDFTSDDYEYLGTLSAHAAHALDRAWEQESDQRARIEAEGLRERADQELARRQMIEHALRASETRYRALASRTTRLHGLTAALSEAVTTQAVGTATVQHATVVVGATAGHVLMVTEDGAHVETLSRTPAGKDDPQRFAREEGWCETDVLATRQPIFIRSWDESQEQYWRSASAAADVAYVSSSALPLLVDGAAVGVLRFDFGVPVNFDEDYQALLVSVAQHCSQALDRARLYESAQRARAEAEAASRLKDDFLSIVSHELRTPLNAVLGWASMLRKRDVNPELAQRAAHSIHENATRQAKLIDDLLDVSRIAAGRATLDVEDIDLSTLVAGVVESLIPVAAANDVELKVTAMPTAWVSGDARRLEQVFFNLLGNALKFTPHGGTITIDARLLDRTVDVHVTDSGIGIDPEFLPHVFERFRQADSTSTRTYGGLGLGLSIAKQLVEAHKGSIAVESGGAGQGATFIVHLPRATGQLARRPPAVSSRRTSDEVPRLDGTRVLIVDDEPAAREVMAYALIERGARVTAAATAADAYGLLVAEPFDVLLADIAMPGEDGCSFMRRVRANGDERVALIPAAAVTAHARDDERRDVLAAGFHAHLVKPIEPGELARAVGALAKGRSGLEVIAT
jgi:signal transduction histidine kinase/ActR/RegA family two-component response regulator